MRKRIYIDIYSFIALLIFLIIIIFPYFWTLISSLKTAADFLHPLKFNFTPTLSHWANVINSQIPHQGINSILVGIITVVIALTVGAPAAYSFSRFNTGGEKTRFLILLSQMLPPAVLIVPIFLLMYSLKLLDTIWAVIFAHLTFITPLVTWFLIGFFDDVPRELEEAAKVDGCTPWQAFLWIVLPTIRPGLAAASLFGFILSWNDLYYALLLTGGKSKTLPVGIAGYWTFRGVEMGQMSSAIILAIIPVIIASFFIQKYLVRGLGGGAIKG